MVHPGDGEVRGGELREDVVVEFAVRRVQASAPEVHAGVCVRAVLSAGQPATVRVRAPRVRRQQRVEAAERAQRGAARRRR